MGRAATIGIIFVFASTGAVYSQRYEIINRPDNHVVPVSCVCSRDSISGDLVLEFFSEGTRAAVHSVARGDTLTIKLVPHRRDHDSQITFASGQQGATICPSEIDLVRILLCSDTALVETKGGKFNLSHQTDQLVLDSARAIPVDVVLMQSANRRTKSMHTLLAAALRQFPNALEPHVLEPGIYPSLEFPVVKVANIGRRQKVNETEMGYLIAFHILDERKMNEIASWLASQNKDI